MLYIMYGEDDFSLGEALTQIKQGMGDKEMVSTNTTVLQGQNITPEQLISTCNTIPFLSSKRLVIVEGLLGLLQQGDSKGKRPAKGAKGKEAAWFALKEYVRQMPESTVLVLTDGKLSKSNPLLIELAPQATVMRFPLLGEDKLRFWIQTRVKKSGGSISPDALWLLTRLIGSNLWLLSNEIDKLNLYALGRRIEKEDVQSLVSEAKEFNVFNMVDAILERRAEEAIKLLHGLEDAGEAPPRLLFMITRQFRMVMQAKELLQQKYKVDDIGRTLGITRAYDALQKTVAQARGYSTDRLKEIYTRLLDTDVSIKTGRYKGDKGELSLDLLISELCNSTSHFFN